LFNIDISVGAQSITITTLPILPNNIVATNYVGLQLISTITDSPISCGYIRNTNSIRNFYIDGVGCVSDESTPDYSTDCNVTENLVTFIYTIQSPLGYNMDFSILCLAPDLEVSIQITVQGIDVM